MVNRITRSTLVGVFAISLGASGVAHAEAPANAEGAPATPDGATEEATAGTVAKPLDSTARWPVEIINRNLTLPKGVWSAGLGLSANNDFSAVGVDATGLWGISYGISDKLSVGVGYGIAVEPSSDGKGPVALNVGYTYWTDKVTLTATASTGYDVAVEGLSPLSLGTMFWYNVTPKVCLFSPGGQLGIGLEEPTEIGLSMPVSVGFQLTKNVFTSLDTNLVPNLALKDGENMMFGADSLPIGATAFYSPNNKLDVGVSVSTDAKNAPADSLGFGLLAIFYGGL